MQMHPRAGCIFALCSLIGTARRVVFFLFLLLSCVLSLSFSVAFSLSLSVCFFFALSLSLGFRELGRTYTRGLGFVWRIKNRHIGFTFPYLRDHKPSSSGKRGAARFTKCNARSRRYESRLETAMPGRVDLTRREEAGRNERTYERANGEVDYSRADVNKFRSELLGTTASWRMFEIYEIRHR